jgi:polyribonucleotide nucleotidyltransferase
MDIKIDGLTRDIMQKALDQAKEARLHILDVMNKAISQPRADVSPYAPIITTIKIRPEKVRTLIGPGGKTIREISNAADVRIEVDDEGKVVISAADQEALDATLERINHIIQEAEVGKLYMGKVRKIMDFGAFVEIFPGTDGLIHISQLDRSRVNKVTDILEEGDEVLVKVLGVDKDGKISLSRKAALGESLEDVS